MIVENAGFPIDIGNRASDLEHSVVTSRRESQRFCGPLEKGSGLGLDVAVAVYPSSWCMRIALHADQLPKAVSLRLAGSRDANPDSIRRLRIGR
jgi:hypothetical protein